MHGQLLNSSNFCIEEKTCPFMATGRLKNHFLVWYNCTSNRGHKNLIQSYSLVGWTRLDSVTIGRQQHLVWINSWEAVTMTNQLLFFIQRNPILFTKPSSLIIKWSTLKPKTDTDDKSKIHYSSSRISRWNITA